MKRFITTALMLSVLFCSCSREISESLNAEPEWRAKIINTKAGAVEGSILVKSNDPSDLLSIKGVAKVTPVFASVKENEALEQECGLDKWYELTLDEGFDMDAVSCDAARKEKVSAVQFNTIFYADDSETEGYYPSQETKAGSSSELPFNDTYLGLQWNYRNDGDKSVCTTCAAGADVNVIDVWRTLTCGDPEIVVAVIDEGVKYTHPDLAANMWKNPGEIPDNGKDDDGNGYVDDVHGFNFTSTIPGPINWDKSSHGTHCAGTIAAVNNNGFGVSGIAGGSGKGDGCRIMSAQGLYRGSGSSVALGRAVKYAADNGASIISCSFGSTVKYNTDNEYYRSNAIEIDAIRYFEKKKNNSVIDGGIAIFSSGNDGSPFSNYPGAMAEFISVSAIGPDYLPTHYTNYGPGCNIAAPGGEAQLPPWQSYKAMVLSTSCSECSDASSGIDINVTSGLDYCYFQGTSMACPHVAGVAALGLSYAKKIGKKYTTDEFKQLLISSTSDIDKRITSTAEKKLSNGTSLSLGPFYHNVGAGVIDCWQFMMNIEGVPCLVAKVGENQWLSLDSYFGSASVSLTYLDVEIDKAGKEALGLTEAPSVKYGKLFIHPTKMGSAKLKIKAVGGGDHVGGGDNPTGGMELTREISVIARQTVSENGGWL